MTSMIHISNEKFDLELPNRIYLIGSGKSLNKNHALIPDDAYRVYLNGAINYKDAKPDLWFAHCQNNVKHNWWLDTYRKFHSISFFGNFITDLGYPSRYCFSFHKDLPANNVKVGTTVAGIGMQLLPKFGVKEIVLVGIDLTDSYRFDGSFNIKNSEPKWADIINRLNNVIDNRTDCSYFSLGETRLNIECI